VAYARHGDRVTRATRPWTVHAFYLLVIVPTDFVMSRHTQQVGQRAECTPPPAERPPESHRLDKDVTVASTGRPSQLTFPQPRVEVLLVTVDSREQGALTR